MQKQRYALVKKEYRIPFILVTSLFFLWGFAHAILDVLNKHFQDVMVISRAHSAWVQVMFYLGYFVMAIPAGLFINKYGYRRGVVFGLSCLRARFSIIYSRRILDVVQFLSVFFVRHRLWFGFSGDCIQSLYDRVGGQGDCCQPVESGPVIQWLGVYLWAVGRRIIIVLRRRITRHRFALYVDGYCGIVSRYGFL